jgi:hypothetical protein
MFEHIMTGAQAGGDPEHEGRKEIRIEEFPQSTLLSFRVMLDQFYQMNAPQPRETAGQQTAGL